MKSYKWKVSLFFMKSYKWKVSIVSFFVYYRIWYSECEKGTNVITKTILKLIPSLKFPCSVCMSICVSFHAYWARLKSKLHLENNINMKSSIPNLRITCNNMQKSWGWSWIFHVTYKIMFTVGQYKVTRACYRPFYVSLAHRKATFKDSFVQCLSVRPFVKSLFSITVYLFSENLWYIKNGE